MRHTHKYTAVSMKINALPPYSLPERIKWTSVAWCPAYEL